MGNIYFDIVPVKRGRPKKILNEDGLRAVEKLAAMHCTTGEIVAFLDTTEMAVRSKDNKDIFAAAIEKGISQGNISIRKKQFDIAMTGNVPLLIWLGKQWLGQTDKQEILQPDAVSKPIQITLVPASQRKASDE